MAAESDGRAEGDLGSGARGALGDAIVDGRARAVPSGGASRRRRGVRPPRLDVIAGGLFERIVDRLKRSLRGEPTLRELVRHGLRAGEGAVVESGCHVDPEFCHLITLGAGSVLSPGCTVLAHDASANKRIGKTRVAPVTIGDRVFVGAGSIVLPGVEIGDDVIVAAGSVVSRSVPARSVVAGVPARAIGTVDEHTARHRERLAGAASFAWDSDRPGRHFSGATRQRMRDAATAGGDVYVD